MPAFSATHEEVVKVITHFYPGMIFTLHETTYEGLIVHPESPVPKPSFEEMESHYPEARQLILADRAYQEKLSTFQTRYSLQDQLVNIFTASQQAANFAEFKNHSLMTAMRQYWNNL